MPLQEKKTSLTNNMLDVPYAVATEPKEKTKMNDHAMTNV